MLLNENVKGYEHIGIPTKDMDATIEFYTTLGFQIRYETIFNNGRTVFLGLGDILIETYEVGEKATGKRGAIDHMAFTVEDVETALEEIKKAKYEVIEGPTTLPFWGNGYRFFSIIGPNSEVVEFGRKL